MNRRGFTIIELMVAGMMATIVLGGITISLSQLGSAKAISRQRLEAFSRCDTAIRTLRGDVITTLRRGDLFHTRLLITDATHRFQGDIMNQDELLVFDGELRANKEIDFNGEGMEYETQFRLETNDVSSALWKRRDAILDDNPIGGGMATPIADGIIALQFEAFDGISWFPEWDSDEMGIPHALRITVTSTGMQYEGEMHAALVSLRTIVPLDRVKSPDDKLVLIAQEEEDARLAALGIEPEGEDGMGLDTAGGSSGGSSGSSSGTTVSGKPSSDGDSGTGASSRPGMGTTIIDPDGNEHEIPPAP
jgi:type II secretory pathway pseudopilin PulG